MADSALPSQRRPRGRIAGGAAIVAPGRGRARGRTDGLTDDGEITPKEERVAFPPSFPSPFGSIGGRTRAGRRAGEPAGTTPLSALSVPSAIRAQSDGRNAQETELLAPDRSSRRGRDLRMGYVDNYSLKVSVSMYLCNILSHGNICICRNVSLLRTLNMERGRMRSVRAERLHFRKASRLN